MLAEWARAIDFTEGALWHCGNARYHICLNVFLNEESNHCFIVQNNNAVSNVIEDYHLNRCSYLLPLNRWQSEDAVVVVVAVNASSIRDKTVAKSQ